MADNAQKIPLNRSQNAIAQKRAIDTIQLLGKALPASVVSVTGSIVTVKFELTSSYTLPNVTVPALMWEYIRVPIQVGDKGMVVPADAYIGGMSGLGGGTADLSMVANLSALIWVPVANNGWSAPINPNALELWGPDGVILRTKNGDVKLTVSADGFTFDFPAGKFVTVNGNGQVNGNWVVTGNMTIQGNIQLGGNWLNQAGTGVYTGNIQTSGNIIAGVGGADQVGLQSHTHQYDRPTGTSSPNQTLAPKAGT